MIRAIHQILILLLFSNLLFAQNLKKPHQFLIPNGGTIQHNKLSKPKYLPSKLDSRAFGSTTPVYHALNSDVLKGLRTDIHVISIDESGKPGRFICSAKQTDPSVTTAAFWSQKLVEKLRLGPETGISYQLREQQVDNLGITHLKYNQLFDGLPVIDAEYFVHVYADNTALAHGAVLQPSEAFTAKISKENAFEIAKNNLKSKGIICIPASDKNPTWIKLGLQESILGYWRDSETDEWHLVYQLDIFPNAMSRWIVTVDAVTGKTLKAMRNQCMFNFMDAENTTKPVVQPGPLTAEKTTAKDLFDINRTIDVWRENGTVYLLDASRPMFKANQFKLDDPAGAIWTLDAKNTNPNNLVVDQISTSNNTWPKNGVSAHYNAGLAFEYYANTHGRNSINGQGGTIISVVNVNDESGGGLDNAFWNGEAMFYGNGASAFNSLAKGLDVGGHEMSHGVIQSTANLAYEGESGAINESFADIFGVMIDRNDWKIGEDVVKLSVFPSGALRDMSDPHNGASANDFRWQPKHVNEKYTGSNDNGGVHINSGIPNYAFYLFVQEIAKSSNEDQAKKIAEVVYYKALNQYLTRSSQFKDLRNAIEQACIDLHGANSNVHNAAKKAFDQVGIGTSGGGGGNYQKDLPVNPGKEFVVCTDDANNGVYLIDLTTNKVSQLSFNAIKSKPSVSDDGSEIYYVGSDSRLYALYYNASKSAYEEVTLDSDPIYRNASISKDGALLAVLYEQEENKIHVYEFAKDRWNVFTLTNPTTSNGVATSNVRYADFMDFEPSGQYLMYDCLSKLDRDGGGTYLYWDIGFLRVWSLATKTFGDGHIEKLFANLPDNTSVGNPVYSKNSPYIMAFDYLEENFFGSTFSVMAANIETGDVGEIAIDRNDTGYPSYSVKDNFILYNGVDNSGTVSLKYKPLATNKIQSNGAEQLFISGARWGSWFANGKRSLVNTSNESKLKGININPNPFHSIVHINLESNSDQSLDYAVFNSTGQPITEATVKLLSGINTFDIKLQHVPNGIYYLQLKTADGKSGYTLNKIGE